MDYLAPQLSGVEWRDGTTTTVELRQESPAATQVQVSHTGAQPPSGWALDLAALREYVANVD